MASIDTQRLKETWAAAELLGDQVPLFFYSLLFILEPDTVEMFPASMAAQREAIVRAIGRIVARAGDTEAFDSYLRQLGIDHRKYGVEEQHYEPVGLALIWTLEYFLGEEWTAETEQSWLLAWTAIAGKMKQAAADAAAQGIPPWWTAVVTDVQQDGEDLDRGWLVLKVDDYPLTNPSPISVCRHGEPGMWCRVPARRSDDDELIITIDAHDGTVARTALAHSTTVGDLIRLGPPTATPATTDQEVEP